MIDPSGQKPLFDRYVIQEVIGQGSSGIVYRAVDSVLKQEVAIKVLPAQDLDSLYRLKREFRSLCRIYHPRLVRLLDLFVDGNDCLLAMQLVEGQELRPNLFRNRAGAEPAWDRIRETFRMLADGVATIHRNGLVHRDLKPENLRVRAHDDLVILDFGLSTLIDPVRGSLNSSVAGSLDYMAPEVLFDQQRGPDVDWFSVGVLLHEALTERLPFERRGLQRQSAAVAWRESDAVPQDLREIVDHLLANRPSERLEGAQRLQGEADRTGVSVSSEASPLIGRASETKALRDLLEDAAERVPTIAVIEGETGIGKSALAGAFADQHEKLPGTVVLRSACYANEWIPFCAFDGILEELARTAVQRGIDLSGLTADAAADLITIFPVLGRLSPYRQASRASTDRQELRARAFAALSEFLRWLTDRLEVLIWIDDAQWADKGDAQLFDALTRGHSAPPIKWLLCQRMDPQREEETLGARAQRMATTSTLELKPLGPEDIHGLTSRTGSRLDAVASDYVYTESNGNPLMALELSQLGAAEAAGSIRLLVDSKIRTLPPSAKRLLQHLAVPGHPVGRELAVALDEGRGDFLRLLELGLLRVAGREDSHRIAIYHDRIREAIASRVDPTQKPGMFARLALEAERLPGPNPHELLGYFIEAGDSERAASLVLKLADEALDALAFERAADFFQRALDFEFDDVPRERILERLAEALLSAGRTCDAGESYLAAASEAAATSAEESRRLRRRAAEELLRGGDRERGIPALQGVLADWDIPWHDSDRRVELGLVLRSLRWRFLRMGDSTASGQGDQERLDAVWAAGIGMSNFDAIRGADFQVRHALLSRRTSELAHRALSVSTEAIFLSWRGGTSNRQLAHERLVEGRGLAEECGDERAIAHSLMASAVSALYDRRLGDALNFADRTEQACRTSQRGAHWEIANAASIRANVLVHDGSFAALRNELDARLLDAQARGDLYGPLMLPLGLPNLAWTVTGHEAEGTQWLDCAEQGSFRSSGWAVYQGGYARVLERLHAGQPEAARETLERIWKQLAAMRMFQFLPIRAEFLELRARIAIARLLETGASGDSRELERDLRKLRGEDATWTTPHADALEAAKWSAVGGGELALRALRRAEAGFDSLGFELQATVARRRVGQLLDDRDLVASSTRLLNAAGAVDADRLSELVLPFRVTG